MRFEKDSAVQQAVQRSVDEILAAQNQRQKIYVKN